MFRPVLAENEWFVLSLYSVYSVSLDVLLYVNRHVYEAPSQYKNSINVSREVTVSTKIVGKPNPSRFYWDQFCVYIQNGSS